MTKYLTPADLVTLDDNRRLNVWWRRRSKTKLSAGVQVNYPHEQLALLRDELVKAMELAGELAVEAYKREQSAKPPRKRAAK